MLTIMLLRHAQAAGHRPIALMGGVTGLVGDPTGKSESRPVLTPRQLEHNLTGQRAQLSKLLDLSPGRGLVVNNADWILPVSLIDFLGRIGTRFSVSQMLAAETYQSRLGSGLTFTEFTYMLLQAYDFLHLYQEYDCVMQVGGGDQWANCLAGADLIRRVAGGTAYVLVTPLLTTASGAKMGKTASGAVWLDPARTSPYDFFQYWVNTEDTDVERFLALFTDLPMDEVRRLGDMEGKELREAKLVLAHTITAMVHGKAEADGAQAAAAVLFGEGGETDNVPTRSIEAKRLASSLTAVDLLVAAGLCATRGEARRLIQQGGATIGGTRVEQPDALVDPGLFATGGILLRAGKKRFRRIVVAEETRADGGAEQAATALS
jgi:tyrosyl-tRNA synthetase